VNFNYQQKFNSYLPKTHYSKLHPLEQEFIKELSFRFKFTFQEFRQVAEAARDLSMWNERGLAEWWLSANRQRTVPETTTKKIFLQQMSGYLLDLRRSKKEYLPANQNPYPRQPVKPVVYAQSTKNLIGPCPVASDKTLCCQLRTIDAVENCTLGCTYCTIQTFYTDRTVINTGLPDKLVQLKLNRHRYYHFGSGQASDSLALGNIGGILDTLCAFAADHPNVLLELKTKSKNINYFLKKEIPPNIVCSWSLNPEIIITHEEPLTASLKDRLTAARKLADRGIKVAFHFHPMIYYRGWDKDYPAIAGRLMQQFTAGEVLFLSFGSMTLIKPVIRKIRNLDIKTKTLQMELVADPLGKLTYPDAIKIHLFKILYGAFRPWYGKVYMYLCMEKPDIWQQVFGYRYKNNSDFEQDFALKTIGRIYPLP
jgi:spore photoproduct lyase